jgi:hypothetical protein
MGTATMVVKSSIDGGSQEGEDAVKVSKLPVYRIEGEEVLPVAGQDSAVRQPATVCS